eukprot:5151982-Pleurochrysis_carterae.AAC.1
MRWKSRNEKRSTNCEIAYDSISCFMDAETPLLDESLPFDLCRARATTLNLPLIPQISTRALCEKDNVRAAWCEKDKVRAALCEKDNVRVSAPRYVRVRLWFTSAPSYSDSALLAIALVHACTRTPLYVNTSVH